MGIVLIVVCCKDVQLITIGDGKLSLTKYEWWGLQKNHSVVNIDDILKVTENVMSEPTDMYPAIYDLQLTLKDRIELIPNWRGKKKVSSLVDSITNRRDHFFLNAPLSFLSLFGLVICLLAVYADDASWARQFANDADLRKSRRNDVGDRDRDAPCGAPLPRHLSITHKCHN